IVRAFSVGTLLTFLGVASIAAATVPSAPQNLQASPDDGKNYLGWQAPSSNGGAAITRYRVFRGTTSSNQTLVTSGGCGNLGVIFACTDTGLTNGQKYYYFVSADNSAGTGAPSNVVSATPLASASVPGPPQNLQASPDDGKNYLGWQAPSSNGGAAITRYRVFRGTTSSNQTLVTSGGCANLGVIFACTDTGLTNGQKYYYFVSADNSAGTGAPSNVVSATPLASASVPGPPQNLQASPDDGKNYLGWQAPSSNGGAAITRYRVFRGTTSSNQTLVTSGGCANLGVIFACTDTGLTNGQKYYYFVSADNSAGTGAPSNVVSATPLASASVPGPPQNLQASPDDGKNYLGWQAPSSNGGAAITRYRVFRGTTSSNQTLVTSGGCGNLGVIFACTDTGLTNGQKYYYFVSADNSAGTGAPSNTVDATPFTTATPTLTASLSANPAGGTAPFITTLSATAGGTATGTITYTFWWNCADARASVSAVTAACGNPTSAMFGMQFDSVNSATQATTTYSAPATYSAKVIIERGGASPAEQRTSIIVASTNTNILPAPAPTGPAGNNVSTSPTFAWSPVGEATSYRLMLATTAGALPTDLISSTCSGCTINTAPQTNSYTPPTPLNAGTTYYWQVQGRNATKNGTWSTPVSFTTATLPDGTQPNRGNLSEDPSSLALGPTLANRAVVITHGWKSNATGWVKQLTAKLCDKPDARPIVSAIKLNYLTRICHATNWDVWVLDWQSKAANSCHLPCPWEAYANASAIGENLALNLRAKNYSYIHFIAHSAGANLNDFATIGLKFWVQKENRPALQIHETFLDAHDPGLDSSRYGKQADWADSYVDTRDVGLLSGVTGFDGTKLFLQNAYNIDVTPN